MSHIANKNKPQKEGLNFKGHKDDLMDFLKEGTSASKRGKNNNSKNSDREDKIVEIIKDKKEVSIKDITDSFAGVSSKTIQRELSKLVDKGILIKEGERRWSKYRMN